MAIHRIIRGALEAAGLLRQTPTSQPPRSAGSPKGLRKPPGGDSSAERGQFTERTYTNPAGTRNYKLYVPVAPRQKPTALVLMLHGCRQDPDDFAAGTCMNQLADRHGFLVVYPAQPMRANGLRCWNWFDPDNQNRDRGEPSLIAGIAQTVAAEFGVESRIYIAGLSAGAAMAVIMGATYPELFCAVGVHSGLPYGAASSVSSAFAAMRGGNTAVFEILAPNPVKRAVGVGRPVPTIVFHGDSDGTVEVGNGLEVVEQATALAAATHGPLQLSIRQREKVNGREFSVSLYLNSQMTPVVEHWVIHNGGHAWSGGSSKGSFADDAGPHASAEMVRFFFAQKCDG